MKFLLSLIFTLHTSLSLAQKKYDIILKSIENNVSKYESVANQIWSFAEVGYQEEKSSTLLQKTLSEEDFSIETGVANIPTAFVASYGSGSPVIGILGEYDALPGLSQQAVPYKLTGNDKAGHACGHHLFGTASAAAAIAIKNYIKNQKIPGTIKYYGCPAEEGGSGKVYMVREGLFDDLDVALHWHAADENSASAGKSLANKTAKFRFYGVSSHASGSPQNGRSALDGVEAMNHMVNMLREHTTESTRIHYVITRGGNAPNVVPDFAEVYYYARHEKRDEVQNIFNRIVSAAEGAAIGTETTMDYEVISGVHELLHIESLQRRMHKNLKKIGGYFYDEKEKAFAEEISKTLGVKLNTNYVKDIAPYNPVGKAGGSTDVGDVSFAVPTVGLRAATWVPGTSAHSWQAVAAGGTSIGIKGMMVAAKTLALTGMQLIEDPKAISLAKKEFLNQRGLDFKYEPLLGDREPALDYRN